MFSTKRRKLKRLQNYLTILYNGDFPDGYITSHTNRIDCLVWLVAYYEGKGSSSPQELFEILISKSNPTIVECHWATTLWYWIYKERIYGF
jgi:hypothetical protein